MADLTRYAYDARTGAYVGTTEAHPDPLNADRLLEPMPATSVAPPDVAAGQAAVWDGMAWSVEADHRGEVWFKGSQPYTIEALGDPTTNGFTAAPVYPPPTKPTSCSRLGLMRAFKARGLWPTVRAMIAADADMTEEWDLAETIYKSDPLVKAALGGLAQMGIALSDADVDQLIAEANAAVAPAA